LVLSQVEGLDVDEVGFMANSRYNNMSMYCIKIFYKLMEKCVNISN